MSPVEQHDTQPLALEAVGERSATEVVTGSVMGDSVLARSHVRTHPGGSAFKCGALLD